MTQISQVVTPVAPPPNPPIGVPLPGKQARPPGLCPIRATAVSNPLASPVIAGVLGPCVPAKTTGTRANRADLTPIYVDITVV